MFEKKLNMKLYKVSTKGRITLPAELRKKYKLTPGKRVRFIEEKDGLRMIPLATPEEIKANIGFLGTGGKMLKALMEEKKKVSLFYTCLTFIY